MNISSLKTSLFVGRLLAMISLAPLLSGAGFAQTPIIEYKFNETGTAVHDTGSSNTTGAFYKNASTQADLSSDDGLGVSGQPGDRAFFNTRTSSGSNYTGGAINSGSVVEAIDQMTSFTLMGWFNTGDANLIASGARLISFDNATGGVALWSGSDGTGKLTLTVNGSSVSSSQLYTATDSWQFFAVTYDGTLTANNVTFYVGTTAEGSLSDPLFVSLNKGSVKATDRSLMIGNRVGYDRPFGGYLDNIRIFGSKTDGSGALTASTIEGFRALDAIPEPSVVAFSLVGAVGLLFKYKDSCVSTWPKRVFLSKK